MLPTTRVEPVQNVKVECTRLFIDNEFVNAAGNKTFDTINPATFEILAKIQDGTTTDLDRAVKCAREAFKFGSPWRTTMDVRHRAVLLNRLADLLERDIRMLATLNTMDCGKPFICSVDEIRASILELRYCAGWTDKLFGKTIPIEGELRTTTTMEPVGVVGAVLPFNLPTLMMVTKIGPTIAAGCCLVLTPAEQTPLTCLHICKLIKEVGFPKGVINVVPGFGPTLAKTLMHHMDVDKITCTGTTEICRLILKASAESNMKKIKLDMFGKCPNIVFPDTDLEHAVEMCHMGLLSTVGKCGTAGVRTFVHEDIYDEFVKRITTRTTKAAVGDPFDTKIEMGPQIDEIQFKKILDMMTMAKNEGAKLCVGGGAMTNYKTGYFVQPTVFCNVTKDMRIFKEEMLLGPIQLIIKFRNIEEVLWMVDETKSVSIFTKDIYMAQCMARTARVATVWLNCCREIRPGMPYEWGMGREGCEEGILEYCRMKTITMRMSPTKPLVFADAPKVEPMVWETHRVY